MPDVGQPLRGRLTLDATEFKTGVEGAEKSLAGFKEAATELGKWVGVAFSVEKILEFGKASLEEFGQAEKSAALLTNAMRAQGIQSQETRDRALELGESLERKSSYDKVAIRGAEQLLVSLAHLSGDGLERALKDTMDLAAGLQIDLGSAAMMVAKATEGNTNALQRHGVEIHKTGDAATDFSRVQETIERQFGGAAQADLETYSGKVNQLSRAWKDVKEAVGSEAAPAVSALAAKMTFLFDAISSSLKPVDEATKKQNELAHDTRILAEAYAYGRGIVEQMDYAHKTEAATLLGIKDVHGEFSRTLFEEQIHTKGVYEAAHRLSGEYDEQRKKTFDTAKATEEVAKKHDDAAEAMRRAADAALKLQDTRIDELLARIKGAGDPLKETLELDKLAFDNLNKSVATMRQGKEIVPQEMLDRLVILGLAIDDDTASIKANDDASAKLKLQQKEIADSNVVAFFAELDTTGNALENQLRKDEAGLAGVKKEMIETAEASGGVFTPEQAERARAWGQAVKQDHDVLRVMGQAVKEEKKDFSELANAASQVSDHILALGFGEEKIEQAAKSLARTLASDVMRALINVAQKRLIDIATESTAKQSADRAMAANEIASTQAVTAAHVAGNTTIVAGAVAAGTALDAATASAARLAIAAWAAEGAAAAGAGAAVGGPIAAGAAAAATYAELIAWEAAVPGLAKGGEVGGRAGGDANLFRLERGETVIDTELTSALKALASKGSLGGGTINIYLSVNSVLPADRQALLKATKEVLLPAIKQAQGLGN